MKLYDLTDEATVAHKQSIDTSLLFHRIMDDAEWRRQNPDQWETARDMASELLAMHVAAETEARKRLKAEQARINRPTFNSED